MYKKRTFNHQELFLLYILNLGCYVDKYRLFQYMWLGAFIKYLTNEILSNDAIWTLATIHTFYF